MARRMPADWEPHRATVMLFCDAEDIYAEDNWIRYIRQDQARLARTIARYEKVILLVSKRNEKLARKIFGASFDIRVLDHCDMWARDTLTTQVIGDDGILIGIDWNYNIWGEPASLKKYLAAYETDVDLMKRESSSQLLSPDRDGFVVEAAHGVMTEGGAIDSDGQGTLLTTKSALRKISEETEEQRRALVEAELKKRTGAKKVIWLPGSTSENDYTGGHIDGIGRFIAPGHVLMEVVNKLDLTPEEKANKERLEEVQDAEGRQIIVTLIESPRPEQMPERQPPHSREFAGLYINFAFVNGAVILPTFGDIERDNEARRVFSDLFPDRVIEQISIDDICEAGGGMHCVTQVIPLVGGYLGKRTGVIFSALPFDMDIQALANEYARRGTNAWEDSRWLSAGKSLAEGEFSMESLRRIHYWKNRGRGRFDLVLRASQDDLIEAINVARQNSNRSVAVSVLSGLPGIGIPTASAILAAMFPERFTVIDFRAFEVLGINTYSLTVPFYLDYLDCCQKLVVEHNIRSQAEVSALRILDRALWQKSKEDADRKKKSGA